MRTFLSIAQKAWGIFISKRKPGWKYLMQLFAVCSAVSFLSSFLLFLGMHFSLTPHSLCPLLISGFIWISLSVALSCSKHLRCFSILFLLSCGLRNGRNALITAGTGVVVAGNIQNIFHNLKVLADSITCHLEYEQFALIKYYVEAVKWIYEAAKLSTELSNHIAFLKHEFTPSYSISGDALKQELNDTKQEIQRVANQISFMLTVLPCIGQKVLPIVGIFLASIGTGLFIKKILGSNSAKFKNSYITKQFIAFDEHQKQQQRPCLLPLNRKERKDYVTIPSFCLTRKDRKNMQYFFLPVIIHLCIWLLFAAVDYLFYWLITSVNKHLQEVPDLEIQLSLFQQFSDRCDLFLVSLHFYWNFLCKITTWHVKLLKFPSYVTIAIPVSELLTRIQGYSQSKDKKTNGEVRGITYLDHAGSALFPESLLKAFTDDLRNNVYGNPHSQNISSKLTYDTIEHVRYRILQHFHTTAEDYTIIFTSGCTAALKLVAEAFPWIPEGTKQPSSRFCYLTDSHTSVVGMRGITASMNVLSVPIKPKEILLSEKNRLPAEEQNCMTPHLFSYPAQSNFSGTKYPLSWIQDIKSGKLHPIKIPGKWFVLLDAASYVSSSPLDLGVHQADFIPISFYKIFGFPTGLGALLVNNRIAPLLKKTYFGGGTAAAYLAGEDFYFPRKSIAERFEDGTVSFLDIIALKHGFDVLEKLTGGMEKIKQHTFALAHYTYTMLSTLKYANGAPVVRIYSDTDFSNPDVQGPIINFNVLDENGEVIGFSQVDKMASLYNIHVRTGCFCNTGACQMHLGMSNEDIQRNLQAGHVCGDDTDLVNGRPTGSVRISFGYMSSFEDAQTFLKFIMATRLSKLDSEIPFESSVTKLTTESVPDDHPSFHSACKLSPVPHISDRELGNNLSATEMTLNWQPPEVEAESIRAAVSEIAVPTCRRGGKPVTVTNIYLYPIKSCSAFEVTEWPVGNQGLLYDRNWMVVNQNGVCMTQKQEPRLCLVNPSIDLKQKVMVIQAEGMDPISVSLEENTGKEAVICESKVCSHRVKTYDCGERIAGWFSMFLGRPCRLIRQSSDMKNRSHQKNIKGLASATNISLSLVNEAQYLLINVASILKLKEHISARLEEPLEIEELMRRFRANIVISAPESFEEEEWAEISIGALQFQVVGPCSRCQIICIDQQSGERNKEFLQSLSAARGRKTNFGIYLMNQPLHSSFPDVLSVGSQVLPVLKENTEIQPPTSSEEKCSG